MLTTRFRHIDVFAGIGGFSLGLERTGRVDVIGFVEINEFCQRVLAKNWPGVPIHDDVKTRQFQKGEADIITGGFPCQDVSLAGRRAGLSGERSGLYRELLRAIFVVRPKYAIVENVAALLSDGMGTVLGDMATGGVDAEWDCVPAFPFGAPHERDRVWIVAHPNGFDGRSGTGGSDGPQVGDAPSRAAPYAPDAHAAALGPVAVDGEMAETCSDAGTCPPPHPQGEQIGPPRQPWVNRRMGSIATDLDHERPQGRRVPPDSTEGDGGSISDPAGDGCGQGRPWRPPDSFARIREQTRRYIADPHGTRLAFGKGVTRDAQPQQPAAERGGDEDVRQSIWPDEPALSGVDDGCPDWTHRVAATGNAIIPAIPEAIMMAILDQLP